MRSEKAKNASRERSASKDSNLSRYDGNMVSDVMSGSVVVARLNQSIASVAQVMAEERVSCVVVVHDGAVVGILTEKDFVTRVVPDGRDRNVLCVSDVMSSPVISVTPNMSVLEASKFALGKRVKHLPVVEDGVLVGIVTQTDMIQALSRERLSAEVRRREETLEKLKGVEHHVEKANAELAQIDNRLHYSVRQAQTMAERALLAELAKNQVLADITYEIGAPLNTIIGFSDVLLDENLEDQHQVYVESIRQSAESLKGFVSNLLDFSRAEAGGFDAHIKECSVGELLSGIEESTRKRAEARGLEFKICREDGVPDLIMTDEVRLRQCIIHLLDNAIKFTGQGHIFVGVSWDQHEDDSWIQFEIGDTGAGIPPERQETIFDMLSYAGDHSRGGYASGLGLVIARHLAGVLGGSISLSSEVGRGSVFTIRIPVEIKKESDAPHLTPDLHSEEKASDNKRRTKLCGNVLVVEDSITNQALVRILLERFGLSVVVVDDGEKAVHETAAKRYDVILMDMQMPKMDGYEATKAIRENGVTTPIVAFTAFAMPGDKEKCLAAGCDDYLTKPVDREKMFGILSNYLRSNTDIAEDHGSRVDAGEEAETSLKPRNDSGNSGEVDTVPINWERVIGRFEDEDIIKEVIPIYLQDNQQRMEMLREAVSERRLRDIKTHAHALKGAAVNLGAERLSEVAYRLESAGREEDMSEVTDLLAALEEAFIEVQSFLSNDDWVTLAKQQ